MTLESKARRVPKESKVLKAIPGIPAPRARKDLKAQRDHKESLAPKETQESRARQVPRESLALRAIRVTPVPRGSKATKENPEPHILLV